MGRTSQTFVAPHGHKLRCQSNRRYWVIYSDPEQAHVVKRTDNLVTAKTERSKGQGTRSIYDSTTSTYVV